MTEVVTPGDNAASPPADPAAPAAPSADPNLPAPSNQPAPNGSEPDNNSGGQPAPAMVPSDRLREETEKRRQAEAESARLQAELEAASSSPPNVDEDVELEPDTEKLLDSYAKKRGLVSQEELAANQAKVQVQQDINDLTTNPPVAGIPYDHKAVADYAAANNLPIISKAALEAAYKQLNWDKILEVERQKTIDGLKNGNSSSAEQPGSGGATPPVEPKLEGKTPKERIRERIRNARQPA